MALRSLAGKIGGRLLHWASASRDAPPPAAASDLKKMALERINPETSLEETVQAMRKSFRETVRLHEEETRRRHRKENMIAGIGCVVVFGAYFTACSIAGRVWKAMRAEEKGKMVEAKEEGKTMDEEQV